MLWGYYLVQVWPFWKLLSGPSLFFSKHRLPKNTIKIGVSAHFFWKQNCAQKIWKLLSGPSWRFLRCSQLGPDNNFQLGPDNNFQKCHFFVIFCFEKCAKMPSFIVFFEKQPKKCKKKCQKKNDNFSHFAKHRFIKKKTRFVATPFFLKKCVFQLVFLKPKTMMLNKKHNSKSGKKQRWGKEISKRKQDRKPKKENILMKKRNSNLIFSCSSQETKAQKTEQKKETKTRKKKKAKKERQEGRKKDKSKTERQRKRKWKRGRPKKVKGERKGNTENKPKNALFRGKNRFFLLKTKKGKEAKKKKTKKRKQTKKTNKEGLGPSEVALRATSPDP